MLSAFVANPRNVCDSNREIKELFEGFRKHHWGTGKALRRYWGTCGVCSLQPVQVSQERFVTSSRVESNNGNCASRSPSGKVVQLVNKLSIKCNWLPFDHVRICQFVCVSVSHTCACLAMSFLGSHRFKFIFCFLFSSCFFLPANNSSLSHFCVDNKNEHVFQGSWAVQQRSSRAGAALSRDSNPETSRNLLDLLLRCKGY